MYLFNKILVFQLMIISLSGMLLKPLCAANKAEMIHRVYVAGLEFSANSRSGIFELSDGKQQRTRNELVPMIGIELGKRLPIMQKLRLFVPAGLSFGYVKEVVPELVALENGTSVELELRRNYLKFGLVPQFQYSFPVVEKKTFFYLSAGGGINYVIFNEEERVKSNSNIRIIDKGYLEEGRAVSFSCDLGAGLDVILAKKQALSIVYGFKLWQPINYKTSRDLFPYSAIQYKETFLTHKIGIQFLISRI